MRKVLFVVAAFVFAMTNGPAFAADASVIPMKRPESRAINVQQGAPQTPKQPYIDSQGREIMYDENGLPFYYVKEEGKTDEQVLEEVAREYRERQALERRLNNEITFERDLNLEFPFSPDQIKKARKKQAEVTEALQLPVPNQGVQRSQVVSLKPGAKNGVIRCYPQYASTIRVLDANGNPWPILAHMIGNAANFEVQKPEMEPYDTIIVSPKVSSGSTNLVLMLDNQDGEDPVPPLALQLVVSPNFGSHYDTVASIRVDRRGPRTPTPMTIDDSTNFNTDQTMLAFLDGVPPSDALRLKTNDKDVDAWEFNSMIYVRSPRKIIWPAWTKQVSSGDGQMFTYELPPVPSVMFSGNKKVAIGKFPANVSRLMKGE